MKAARFHGPQDIQIQDIPAPELRPGAVLIDIAWCGICGTDLHEFLEGPIFIPAPGHPHPLTHERAPVTMGHEFSGTISALGEGLSCSRRSTCAARSPTPTTPATIELVRQGRVDLAPFITAKLPLDRLVADGFDTLIHRNETAVKILVHP